MSPHGTRTRYNAGCRCDDCRLSNNEYHRWYHKQKNQTIKDLEYMLGLRDKPGDSIHLPDVAVKDLAYEIEEQAHDEITGSYVGDGMPSLDEYYKEDHCGHKHSSGKSCI